jgi:hypothetical protein
MGPDGVLIRVLSEEATTWLARVIQAQWLLAAHSPPVFNYNDGSLRHMQQDIGRSCPATQDCSEHAQLG